MKSSDWLSLAIGAVVLYILYEWMQGAQAASGAVSNTLQSAPVGGGAVLLLPYPVQSSNISNPPAGTALPALPAGIVSNAGGTSDLMPIGGVAFRTPANPVVNAQGWYAE